MSEDFERLLRGGMERLTRDLRVPRGLAMKAGHDRRTRRATRAVTAVAGVAFVTAAAVAAAGMTGAFAGAGPRRGGRIQMDSYLVSRVEHALSSPSLDNLIGHATTTYPAGDTIQPVAPGAMRGGPGGASSPWTVGSSQQWMYHFDMTMSTFAPDGHPVFSLAGADNSATAVIYFNHTWWTGSLGGPRPSARPAPSGDSGSGTSGSSGSGTTGPGATPPGCDAGIELNGGAGNGWPAFIRHQLDCGEYQITGHQVINGVSTIEIANSAGTITFWVDPSSYLPVRSVISLGPGGARTTSYEWLSPTPANLARLKLAVPAGYQQVPAP